MEEQDRKYHSFDEAMSFYRDFNRGLTGVVTYLNYYSHDPFMMQEHAETFILMPTFEYLPIHPEEIEELSLTVVKRAVEALFNYNLEDLAVNYEMMDSNSDTYQCVIHRMVSSQYSTTELIKGLNRMVDGLRKIAKIGDYYSNQMKQHEEEVLSALNEEMYALPDALLEMTDEDLKNMQEHELSIEESIEEVFRGETMELHDSPKNLLSTDPRDWYSLEEGASDGKVEQKAEVSSQKSRDPFAEANLNLEEFMKQVHELEDELEQAEMIREEIKRVKKGRAQQDTFLYFEFPGTGYLSKLDKLLHIFLDDIDKKEKIDAIRTARANGKRGDESAATSEKEDQKPEAEELVDPRNPEFTMNRRVIALCCMLIDLEPRILDQGNKRNVSRFIHFLIGQNERNIYTRITDMPKIKTMSQDKDYEFVIDEFRKVGLDALASEMAEGERWWM